MVYWKNLLKLIMNQLNFNYLGIRDWAQSQSPNKKIKRHYIKIVYK